MCEQAAAAAYPAYLAQQQQLMRLYLIQMWIELQSSEISNIN